MDPAWPTFELNCAAEEGLFGPTHEFICCV